MTKKGSIVKMFLAKGFHVDSIEYTKTTYYPMGYEGGWVIRLKQPCDICSEQVAPNFMEVKRFIEEAPINGTTEFMIIK